MQEDDGLTVNVNVNVNVCVCVCVCVCACVCACVVRVYCKPAYKATNTHTHSLSLIMRLAIHQAKSLIYRLRDPRKRAAGRQWPSKAAAEGGGGGRQAKSRRHARAPFSRLWSFWGMNAIAACRVWSLAPALFHSLCLSLKLSLFSLQSVFLLWRLPCLTPLVSVAHIVASTTSTRESRSVHTLAQDGGGRMRC